MRILVVIPNYEAENILYLHLMLKGFEDMDITFNVVLFSTLKTGFSREFDFVDERVHTSNMGKHLPLECYRWLQTQDLEKYDFILYTENDLLFTEANFFGYQRCWERLAEYHAVPGFVRYELKGMDDYLVDHNNIIEPLVLLIGDKQYFTPENVHSGCWMMAPWQYLQHDEEYGTSYKNFTLEDYASHLYKGEWPGSSVGYTKATPIKDFSSLLVHHQPDKYCKIYPTEQPSVDHYLKYFRSLETSH